MRNSWPPMWIELSKWAILNMIVLIAPTSVESAGDGFPIAFCRASPTGILPIATGPPARAGMWLMGKKVSNHEPAGMVDETEIPQGIRQGQTQIAFFVSAGIGWPAEDDGQIARDVRIDVELDIYLGGPLDVLVKLL